MARVTELPSHAGLDLPSFSKRVGLTTRYAPKRSPYATSFNCVSRAHLVSQNAENSLNATHRRELATCPEPFESVCYGCPRSPSDGHAAVLFETSRWRTRSASILSFQVADRQIRQHHRRFTDETVFTDRRELHWTEEYAVV